MDKKIETLTKVAKALNDAGIEWALGGSGALYFRNVVDSFRDVDLMVAQKDVHRAEQVIGKLSGVSKVHYEQKYDLLQYCIDGVDFDVMKGFVHEDYSYTLQSKDVLTIILLQGVSVPLHNLLVWRQFYQLMERPERVTLIDEFLKLRK